MSCSCEYEIFCFHNSLSPSNSVYAVLGSQLTAKLDVSFIDWNSIQLKSQEAERWEGVSASDLSFYYRTFSKFHSPVSIVLWTSGPVALWCCLECLLSALYCCSASRISICWGPSVSIILDIAWPSERVEQSWQIFNDINVILHFMLHIGNDTNISLLLSIIRYFLRSQFFQITRFIDTAGMS